MVNKIKVFAPATVANVACGFDIFGFALDFPGDIVTATLTSKPGVTISSISGDGSTLSHDPQKNTAGVGVIKLLASLQSSQGIDLALQKKMPLGSGLGSSAASAAASLFAANTLLGSPLKLHELVPFAMEAEKAACGAAHADNVAPSLLGGFVLIRSYNPLDLIQIPINTPLFCCVLHPKIEIHTETARGILKKEVSLAQLVEQSGNAAGLITGLILGDPRLISRSLQDVVVEPVRASLIPGFHTIKSAALSAGALGCSISGSGPSIFALASDKRDLEVIGNAMQKACHAEGIENELFLSSINMQGPKIL
ncbi:MAG: homoserine kinase [Parachlamydiales bacterium]|jgi:homoserine kinase